MTIQDRVKKYIALDWNATLGLGIFFLLGGVRGVLVVIAFMLVISVVGYAFLLFEFKNRSDLVEDGTLGSDHWLITFFCKYGWHTRGVVEIEELKTQEARWWAMAGSKDLEKRIGRSHCVHCRKELWVSSFLAMDKHNKGKPYWALMDKKECEEFEKTQRGEYVL